MTEQNITKTDAPKGRKWLKITLWVGLVLFVGLIVLYFTATSSAFLKAMVLPRVGSAINAKVTASDILVSPFSEVVIKDFKIETSGSSPLFAIAEVRARYSLMDIIRGNINIEEVALVSPRVAIVQNADGTSSLDAIIKSQTPASPTPAKASTSPSKPILVHLKKLTLTDGAFAMTSRHKDGGEDKVDINKLNLTVENIANGQSGKLSITADMAMARPPAGTNQAAQSLRAGVDGIFTLALAQDLQPTAVQGNLKLAIGEATGALSQASGMAANLVCDITPTEIKQVSLRLEKSRMNLAEVLVAGPLDLLKKEGNISVSLRSVDKALLNFVGAGFGLDFGPTTIGSTNQILIAKAGERITIGGGINLSQLQVTRTNLTTPKLDFGAQYDLTIDLAAKVADIRTLSLTGTQKGGRLMQGDLTRPMRIPWGGASNTLGDSSFKFELAGFDLADWRAFAGQAAPDGRISAKASILTQAGGDSLTFDFGSEIDNLTMVAGTNRITSAGVAVQAKGTITNLKRVNLSQYGLHLTHKGQPIMDASGALLMDLDADSMEVDLASQVFLVPIINLFPAPDVVVTSGTTSLKAHISRKKQVQEIKGNLVLQEFTGHVGSNVVFKSFGATVDTGITMDATTLQIGKLAGSISENGKTGGSFSLAGTYHLTNGTAQFKATLADFNQVGLRGFLEPSLNGKQLVSVAVNGDLSITANPQSEFTIQTGISLTNLVVKDPSGQIPASPLQAALTLDTTIKKMVTEIKQLRLTLKPTTKAKNEVSVQGKVDMSGSVVVGGVTNSLITGGLSLSADALDLTEYYDLFMGGAAKPGSTSPAPVKNAPSSGVEAEMAPILTPLRNFNVDAKISRLYLHELEITNLVSTLKLDEGKIVLKPFEMRVNGAPVTAVLDMDLGIAGYKYLVSLDATAVPFAPLVNSFAPDRRDQLQGTITSTMEISGKGTTGASLEKNLSGKFDIATTNLNLQIANLRSPLMRTTINIISIIPDLIKGGGGGALGALTGALLGGSKSSGGLSDELSQSPINTIQARGNIGGGVIRLETAMVQSPVFQAGTHGTVTLKPILTNSVLDFPLQVALRRSDAQKINFVPAGTPTNAAYVQLPEFVTIEGTLGEPKKKINNRAILGTALQQIGSNIPGADQKTGGLLQGLGGMLTGQKAATNSAPTATNQTPNSAILQGLGNLLTTPKPATNPAVIRVTTNQPPAASLIQGLGSLLATPKPAPAPPASATVTNQSRTNALLNQLLVPGKK
ncbi:MAG: AsmA family protein [Verrucomicrobia bacterium]|nr:AsmA family protein [Verrucomicrobiota bacterium]